MAQPNPVLPPPGGDDPYARVHPDALPENSGQAEGRAQVQRDLDATERKGFVANLLSAPATLAFVAVTATVFVMLWQELGELPRGLTPVLRDKYGAFPSQGLEDPSQWWRYFSSLFVPTETIGAFIYVWLVFSLGPTVEKTLGTPRFLLMFLLAGAGGIALGELFDRDGNRIVGSITSAYVLLGAVPGLVLGTTLSISQTISHPATRSSAFWIILALLFMYMGPFARDTWSMLGGAGLAFVYCFGLVLTRRLPALGWPLAGIMTLALAGTVAAANSGLEVKDGQLSGGGTQTRPTTGEDEGPGEVELNSEELTQVQSLVRDANRLFERFGPYPLGTVALAEGDVEVGVVPTAEELQRALELNQRAEELALGGSQVGLDLEDPTFDETRVRLRMFAGAYSDAVTLADETASLWPSPRHRALLGVAQYARGGRGLEDASRNLETALAGEGVAIELPEAIFYYALALVRLGDVRAEEQFRRFLAVSGEERGGVPAHRRIMIEQAKTQVR